MLRSSALALLLRRDRSDLAALGMVILLVAFTTFISVAGLRLFEHAADGALRQKVAAAPVVLRTIRLVATRSLFGPEAARTIADVKAQGEGERATFPDPLPGLVGDGNLAMGSVRLRVTNPPEYPIFVTLRYHDGFQELAELASGRWPTSTGEQLPPVAEFETTSTGQPGYPIGTEHSSDAPRRFEIALQEQTAEALGLSIGSELSVAVDLVDPMFQSSRIRAVDVILAPTRLVVTGLYRVRDPDSDAWFGEPGITFDDVGDAGSGLATPIAYINAYMAPEALPGFVTSGLPFEYRWRFPILVDRLEAGAVIETQRGFRVLEARSAGTEAGEDVSTEAGLLPLLERHSALRSASEAVLALAVSAPLALAAAAFAMAAVLLTRRRRAPVILARGRGAAPRLLLAVNVFESVIVVAGACLVGLGLAVAVEPSAELGRSLMAALAIGVVAVVVLGAVAWPLIRKPLADLERDARPTRRTDARRLVAELTLVAFAAVGAYMLRQRGIAAAAALSASPGAGSSVGFDPFLAAVPPLIAFAAGVVALRIYRPTMAFAGWLADRRQDLVPVLGVRTVARGATSSLPVLVLLLAVAFAAFMSVVSTSLDRAQQTAGWAAAGADVRLDAAGSRSELPSTLDPSRVPGVVAAARGFVDPHARGPSGTGVGAISLNVVDAAAYAEVVAGSPIEPRWPQAFLDQPADGPVPVIVGTRLTGGELSLSRGDTLQVTVLGRQVPMQVVEIRSGLAGLVDDDSFVIVPYAWLEHTLGRDVPPSVMWVRAGQEAVAALREQAVTDAGTVRLTSRYDAYAAMRDEPLAGAVAIGFALALGISLAYAVLTIVGAVILSAERRTRDVAILRTLGLNGRQATRLTLVEHAPPILMALPLGIALGIIVALAVVPALGLGALSGSSGTIPMVIDWVTLLGLAVLLSAVALAAVVVGTWLSRRAAIINALRITSD